MRRYELTDEQWALIEPQVPPAALIGRRRVPPRTVWNGIFWVLRSGAPWRDLPERYGAWKTVYDRFRRWSREGLFQRMLDALQQAQGHRADRIDFDFSAVDGSTVRAHKSAAGAEKKGLRRKKARNNRA